VRFGKEQGLTAKTAAAAGEAPQRDWVEIVATALLALAAVLRRNAAGCLVFAGTAAWIATFPISVSV
jgi:hypothetical protein